MSQINLGHGTLASKAALVTLKPTLMKGQQDSAPAHPSSGLPGVKTLSSTSISVLDGALGSCLPFPSIEDTVRALKG
jgi:hypothetical protein